MIVFGHRRVRVASELKINVRAVVKSMDDVSHILAQGQENTARADLSFIEKAMFAKILADMGQSKDVIKSALTIDGTLLSRMLSVATNLPSDIVIAIGPAKQVGRDRWEDFKKLLSDPSNIKLAQQMVDDPKFLKLPSDARFELLRSKVSAQGKKVRKAPKRTTNPKRTWTANSGRIKGVIGKSGKAFSISLTSNDASDFGAYLSENLDGLYQSFLSTKQEKSE